MSTTAFSYAQAARGQPTTHPPTVLPPNTSATANTAAHEKSNAGLITMHDVSLPMPSTILDTNKVLGRTLNHDLDATPRRVGSDTPSSPGASSTLVSTAAESTSNFSLDDVTHHVATSDRPSRVSTPGSRSPSSDETVRTGRGTTKASAKTVERDEKPEQEATSDKEKDSLKVDLTPAPLPAVNVWSQRMIEQAARAKQTQVHAPNKAVSVPTTGSTTSISSGSSSIKPKDFSRPVSSSMSSGAVDTNGISSGNVKSQIKRPNESTRTGAEQTRRNGPRGARVPDKEDRLTMSVDTSLPSSHDSKSWPTPGLSSSTQDVATRMLAERADATEKKAQDDASSVKSRKKGWLPLPFVPTVSFQTPNVRNSKPKTSNRGVRDSSKNGHNSAVAPDEKPPVAASLPAVDKSEAEVFGTNASKETNSNGTPTRSSIPSSSTHKRPIVDVTLNHSREPRKPSTTLSDKTKEFNYQQNTSIKANSTSRVSQTNDVTGDASGQLQQTIHNAYVERRSATITPTKSTLHHSAAAKDFVSHEHKDQHGASTRERTETRGERPSRGAFRGGRGGAIQHQYTGHSSHQANGQRSSSSTTYNSAALLPPTAAPFSPLPQQFSYGSIHHPSRPGARGSSRPQAALQTSFGGRTQHGNSRTHIHPTHGTTGISGEFQMHQFTQFFNPHMDAEVLHGLTLQVEYYFSLDNLCKDVFLRRKMTDQGFVPLPVIAKFKRMSDLAPSLDFIRAACEQSENLDYVVDQEHNEWIRSRFYWGGFILPLEERDEEARQPGPDLRAVVFRSSHSRSQAYSYGMMTGVYPTMPYTSVSPPPYPSNGYELYPGHDGGPSTDYITNGHHEPNGQLQKTGSQLSATVPDFSPGGQNGAPTTLEDYQTCPDEQVEKLVVHIASDREQGVDTVNLAFGTSHEPDTCQEQHYFSQENGHRSNSDDKKAYASDESSRSATNTVQTKSCVLEEPYPKLRAEAFRRRENAKPGETPFIMKQLYQFWTHSLVEKFNVRMYEDFRSSALEDARCMKSNDFGLNCLIQYYTQVLSRSNSIRPHPAVFIPHHLEAEKLLESLKVGLKDGSRI